MKDDDLMLARWDLSPLYSGINDRAIDRDVARAEALCREFKEKYRGRLGTRLEGAVADLIKLGRTTDSIGAYFHLMSSRDARDQEIKKRESAAEEKLSLAAADLAFFDIELGKLPTQKYEAQARKSKLLSEHRPFLDKARKTAKYNLSEEVETILSKLSPFGSGEWDDTLDELETHLSFKCGGKARGLADILNIIGSSHDGRLRAEAMGELNRVLESSHYAMLRARALNMVAGEKATMDRERGFKSPMEARNISNNLDEKSVAALHAAVIEHGSAQGKRYYSILKNLLGKKTLLWSDRNAPAPFEEKGRIPWKECVRIVLSSYEKFSPRLAGVIRESIRQNRIDAPVYPGKTSGAYNYSIIDKRGRAQSYTFLNYLGTPRDVMTLAHELGHAAHGLLSGAKQSALQFHAPMAYAETASIFGEMLAFEHMVEQTRDRKARLALLMSKSNDWLNSVNRQISFSLFEQRVHERRKAGKLSPAEFSEIWLDVSKQMYGRDGEIFKYKDMENLWSYVGHFMSPFYVYAYAFGELFTQSLFSAKDKIGPKFEKLYIEMLESGSTKDAAALMRPFGLNPADPDFWRRGIEASIAKWLNDAEALIKELKL